MADFINQQPQAPKLFIDDPLFLAKLDNIQNYEVRQGNVILEAATAQIWPNTYIISDRDRQMPVHNHPEGLRVPIPVFIVKEDSGCCCRAFCPGNQPLLAKVYHAKDGDGVEYGGKCCGCTKPLKFKPDLAKGPIMTLERDGCCTKCLGCFVCTEGCQNDMYMHVGDFTGSPGTTKPEGTYFARSVMPIGGGGCRPRVDITAGGARANDPFAIVSGPCCFAGWKGLCCGDVFKVSSAADQSADIGLINKREAQGCYENCLRMFTNVDIYNFSFTSKYKSLAPEQKAAMLGNIIHLDYIFFENDWAPIECKPSSDGKSVCIVCTFWECFCYGCVCPCQCCIVLGGDN